MFASLFHPRSLITHQKGMVIFPCSLIGWWTFNDSNPLTDQNETGAIEWSDIQGSVLEEPEFDWLFREDISYADSCKESLRKA